MDSYLISPKIGLNISILIVIEFEYLAFGILEF